MSARPLQSMRGAVILVALCFAAVIGISLASYLAISLQAMRLSNRSFQTDLSRQLAEAGLEQALAAFNQNDWSGWTISGTTATRTVSFASTKYGSLNVAGSFKLRVDNYDAYRRDSTWSAGTVYSVNDLVGHNGVWYRCVKSHSTSETPNGMANLEHWVPEPVGWKWRPGGSYAARAAVNYNGTWYRSTAAGNNNTPGGANWNTIGYLGPRLTSSSNGDVVFRPTNSTWYRMQGTWRDPADFAWQWTSDQEYRFNDLVYRHSGVGLTYYWYRYINPTPATNRPVSNSSYWENALGGAIWAWSPTETYNPGDVVYRNGAWYRALRSHSDQQPPNTSYWSSSPALVVDWVAGKTYPAGSVVRYNGTWYYTAGTTSSARPGSAPWVSASTTTWSSTASYSTNAYVSYAGVWYRCLTANSNQSPNNSSYWTAVGAPVAYSEGIVVLPDGPEIRTQLRANVAPAALFSNALAATESVALGASSVVDSYDSAAGPYSTQLGTVANFSAVVTGEKTSLGVAAVALSSATVRGYVAAPSSDSTPYDPRVSYASSAVLQNPDGSVTSPAASAANVDLARISRGTHIPALQINAVTGGRTLPDPSDWPTGGITIGTPGATVPSVYYRDGSLILNDDNEILTINGPVILSVSGGVRIRRRTSAQIRITETGSLRLHVGSTFRLESSGGGISNETELPENLVVLLSRNGSGTFEISNPASLTQPFHGLVYLPNSNSNFSVGDGVEIYGAISARNVTFTGSASLHYDTQLRHRAVPGVEQAFVISDWRELGGTERATLP